MKINELKIFFGPDWVVRGNSFTDEFQILLSIIDYEIHTVHRQYQILPS